MDRNVREGGGRETVPKQGTGDKSYASRDKGEAKEKPWLWP